LLFEDTFTFSLILMAAPQLIRFWFYLIPVIPSILCSVFVLYHSLIHRAIRNAINNHVVIVMLSFGLFYEVTNIFWYIHFYRTGTSISATPIFCRIWVFIDGGVYVIIGMLMAWASIERHILIFHQDWIATTTKRLLLHYLPISFCAVYPSIYYGALFFVIPCDRPFQYEEATCSYYSCISWKVQLGLWDNFFNFLLPVALIVIFSVALLLRVLYHRCRIHGRLEWRNHRKMAAQLLSISAVYFIFLLPPTVFNTAYTFLPWQNVPDYYWSSNYAGYYTVILTPFVCAMSLPDFPSKFKQLFFCLKRHAVGPTSSTSNQRDAIQTTKFTTGKQ
jgi:hypothetical protein